MSGKEDFLKKQARMMNEPIPDRIKNKPILKSHLMLYYDAFFDLQNDRNATERIPWSVITKYADRYGFSEAQEELLILFIRGLDDTFLKWSQNKRGIENGKPC